MLKLDQITKKFHIGTPDETTLFNQFCFEVQKGEFVSIVGSNGSGKTTLLNIVCGSLPVEGGKVFFGGKRFYPFVGIQTCRSNRPRVSGSEKRYLRRIDDS